MTERFNELIKHLTFQYSISKKELAEKIGITPQNLHKILAGHSNTSSKVLHQLILAFPEVNLNYLIGGKGSVFENNTNISSDLPTTEVSNLTNDSNSQIINQLKNTIQSLEIKLEVLSESRAELIQDKIELKSELQQLKTIKIQMEQDIIDLRNQLDQAKDKMIDILSKK